MLTLISEMKIETNLSGQESEVTITKIKSSKICKSILWLPVEKQSVTMIHIYCTNSGNHTESHYLVRYYLLH